MLHISDCSKYSHVRISMQIFPYYSETNAAFRKRYIFPFVLYQQYIDYSLDHTEPNKELVNNNSASHVGVPIIMHPEGSPQNLDFFVQLTCC